MGSGRDRFEEVVERLWRAGCVAAREEAEEFLAAAPDDATLDEWVQRREQGEPHAWIVGTVQFAGHGVRVDRGVYVPRAQSIDLARLAAMLLPPGGRALDLFTGSGAIALALQTAVPDASVVGIDIDLGAARCARSNGVSVFVGESFSALRRFAWFDVVTAVAPYVPTDELRLLPADVQKYEPRVALDGGGDGLDLLRSVISAAPDLIKPRGWLLTEIGGGQDEILLPHLTTNGFVSVIPWRDEDGDLRGVAAQVGSGPFGHRP